MFIEENAHFSLIHHLKNQFGSLAQVLDSFPEKFLDTPTLAIDIQSIRFTKFQIGDYNNIREVNWLVDIFARTKSQRDRIIFKAMASLEKPIPIYDFGVNFPPPLPPQVGVIRPIMITLDFIDIKIDNPEEIFYRGAGTFTAQLEIIGGS